MNSGHVTQHHGEDEDVHVCAVDMNYDNNAIAADPDQALEISLVNASG